MKEYIVSQEYIDGIYTDEGSTFGLDMQKELIRCKDCKHCRKEIAQGEWEGSCRYWNTHSVMLNDFCSRAERKEE